MTSRESPHKASFDSQARAFDGRAGLPAGARARIADAIVRIAKLGPGEQVLDIGAGTGEIGRELAERGLRYLGIDESAEMLAVFGEKARASGSAAELVVADARARWPVPNATVHLVFGSRSLHWLDPRHVRDETLRAAAAGGCTLLIGRVERAKDTPRARLRRRMRETLREAGHVGRSGGDSARNIVQELVTAGATHVPASVVATWVTRSTPRSVLDAWRGKPGLGGAEVPPALKSAVITRTEAWAVEVFGDIDAPIESEECYTLEGAATAAAR